MKTKSTALLCVLAMLFTVVPRAKAYTDPGAIVLDTILIRPACFVATALGGAVFVISLPFGLISKSVHSAAKSLVVVPAEATFTRPLGDLDALVD